VLGREGSISLSLSLSLCIEVVNYPCKPSIAMKSDSKKADVNTYKKRGSRCVRTVHGKGESMQPKDIIRRR
jgi:hypothetical protein